MYLNGILINFDLAKQSNSYYIISIALSDMDVCVGGPCNLQFYILYPQTVLTRDRTRSMSMNNATLSIPNFINYYSSVPPALRSALKILGIAIGMAFSGGYSSLVTILF